LAESTVIQDDLLRQIIGAGQVDLLVGVPTRDHASTIGEVVRAVRSCLATSYPRLRAAVLHIDQASSDGTVPAGRAAWDDEVRTSSGRGLRTSHYISATADTPVDGEVVRMLLAAADLLQARTVVVIDAHVEPRPGDLAALAEPVWKQEADMVAPVYTRGAGEGLLLTQMVRPLTQAIFARRLAEPLLPAFACSGRFAAHCTVASWNLHAEQRATRYWVAAEALTGSFDVRQCALGPRRVHRGAPAAALQEVFAPIVVSMFWSIEAHAITWLARAETHDLPLSRSPESVDEISGPGPAPQLTDSFAEDVQNLDEILREIVAPETMEAIQAVSRGGAGADYPDTLWAVTLADFLGAFHRAVMRRDHIAKALMPLYRARASSFLHVHAEATAAAVEIAIDSLAERLERTRQQIVRQWTQQDEVAHG
jgi:hypothetical protein